MGIIVHLLRTFFSHELIYIRPASERGLSHQELTNSSLVTFSDAETKHYLFTFVGGIKYS